MKIEPCVRCGQQLRVGENIYETGDPACAGVVFCRSLGLRPRVKSKADRGLFCPDCMISLAHQVHAPEGAFNAMVWKQLREINQQTSSFYEVARMHLIDPKAKLKLMPGSKPDGSLIASALKEPLILAGTG